MYPRLFDQTVAAHSFHVINLAMVLCEVLNQKANADSNRDEILRYATMHDWEEAIVSDIPKGIKLRHPEIQEIIDKYAIEGMADMLSKLNVDTSAFMIDYNSRSWRFIKIVDALEALYTTWKEAKFGNSDMAGVNAEIYASVIKSIQEFFEKNAEGLAILQEIADYLSANGKGGRRV